MGFIKKLFNDVGDAIKNNVEERKQEIRQNIEERKQQFYESIEERKKEVLSKLGVKPEEMMGVYGATSLGELKEIAKDNASIIAKTDEIKASQLKAKQKQELQKKKEPHKVRVSFNINGDEGFTRITMYPLIGKECQQALKNGVEHDRRTGALEVSQDSIDKLSELLTEKNEQLPLEFLFAPVCTPTELIVTDEESDEEIYNDEYEIDPRYGIMSMDEAVDNYEDEEEDLKKYKEYLTDTAYTPDDNYISIGIAKTWDKLPESYIEGEGFVPSVIGETLRVASEDDIALLHGETGLSDSTITFNMEIEDEFDPDKLDFINFDAEYGDVSSVLQETLAADFVSMNAIMYDGKMYFAQPQDMDFGDNEGDDYYDIINHHLEGDQKIDIEPVLEPKPEPEAETKVEVEQKEEPIENGGLFSARLEAMIAAALQDGVLTDKERELLKRRVEKEGEDWEEVEMIIEARLAEMRPTSQPKNGVGRNAVCEKDTVGTPSIPPIETKQVVNVPILDDSIFDRSKAERYSNERNVDIPEGYIELGEECFEESDLQSICLPSTLEKINDNAFVLCNKMKKVDFSKCTSLIEIGDYVFRGCTKLEEIVLPDSVTTIGDGAFYYCTKLRKIVMPSSLEKLGDSVFQDCDSLEEVDMSKVTKLTTIPEGFKTGDDKQMVIPMGVTTIRKDAFEYCNMYALFLPPTLKDYMDTHGNWESVYLFASPLEKMDNIFENSNNLYVLPQYLEVYKSIHEALGEYSWCEIHTMPDEFMFFYDN